MSLDDNIAVETGEFPGDESPIPTLVDASEFRDIDIASLPRTTDFSSLDNETLRAPERDATPRVTRAALTNNGLDFSSLDVVQPVAARSYDAYTSILNAGTATYPGDPMRLVGDDAQRMRCVISVTSADGTGRALVGPIGSVSNGAGFALSANNANYFETVVQGPIYACVPTGQLTPVNVHVWIERGL